MYKGFPLQLISTLVCQKDGSPLSSLETSRYINEGELACKKCGETISIKEGIVLLNTPVGESMQSEVRARDKEAHSYDRRLSERYYKELLPTLSLLGSTSGKHVIEYGCGTGRFTIPVSKEAESIVAIDFSKESLLVLKNKIEDDAVVGLVLGDVVRCSFKERVFDVAFATQVIEHIIEKTHRRTFYAHIAHSLKKDGIFFGTAYHHDVRRRLAGKAQTGAHKGGIPYHYFTKEEFISEIRSVFRIGRSFFLDVTLPLEARIGTPPYIGGLLSRAFSSVPGINRYAHLVGVKAINKK